MHSIHKTFLTLPLPWDVIRHIKLFVGGDFLKQIENKSYDDYIIKFRRRHKGRSFTF